MSFTTPWCLALLAIPMLLLVWEWNRRGQPVALPVDHLPGTPTRWRWRLLRLANLLPALVLAVAIVLIAGPQHQGRPQQERVLTNIELCLDLSGSMTAGFGSDGTRYDGAMAAIEEFTRRREGDAFGLTVFGNEVMRWTPLTQDLAVVRDATPWLRPERMPHQFGGTEIGKALNACLATITKQGSAAGDRLVVLLSDGQSADLGDEQVQSLVSGYSAGNVVFCMVFIGEGAPQSQLYTLANATGGVVVSGGDPAALRECFAYIDRMQPVRLAPKASQPVDQRWPWALGGLVLIALHGVSLLGLRNTPW